MTNPKENLLEAMSKREPIAEIDKKINEYLKWYDNIEPEPNIIQKSEHREIFYRYYMYLLETK